MTTRLVVLWIALQTLLGAWCLWLLLAGAPIAATASDNGEVAPAPRLPAHEAAAISAPAEALQRELATPKAAASATHDSVGVLLYGCITDEQGNPVERALLSIRQHGKHRGAYQTQARGTYSLADLLPGEAELLVRTPGFRNLTATLQLDASTQRHDLVLQRAVVLQVIARTPTGEPLVEAMQAAGMDPVIRLHVIATHEPVTSLADGALHIGVGHFRHARWLGQVQIEGLAAEVLGLLQIDGQLPLHVTLVLGSTVLASQVAQQGQERVEFSLAAQTVVGQLASVRLQLVAASTGRPLAAMRVEGPGVKVTDAEGVAEFTGVIPGQHRLEMLQAGYELDHLVDLEPGQHLDLGRVGLHELQEVTGVVLDPNGRPVRATISWDDLDGHGFVQSLRDDRSAGSDEQGRWQLRLAPHRYALHARTNSGEQQAHLLLDLARGVPEEISLQLQPTVPVELVKEFAASRSYLLSVRTTDGVPVFGRQVRASFAESIQLPAGDYVVDVHEGRVPVRSFALTVGGAKTRIRIP